MARNWFAETLVAHQPMNLSSVSLRERGEKHTVVGDLPRKNEGRGVGGIWRLHIEVEARRGKRLENVFKSGHTLAGP
jgi:hypothetical protein